MMRVCFCLLLLLSCAPAFAQQFDSTAPIDVDAARIDIEDNASEAIFSGAVVIRQGNLTLNADRVRISYAKDKSGSPQVQRLDALGNVRLRQDTMRATANSGIYDLNSRLVTLVGNVQVDRAGDRLQGARVVWNLNTRSIGFDNRSAANAAGRVTGRFTVPSRRPPN